MMPFIMPLLALLCCVTAFAQSTAMIARISSVTGTALLSNGDGMPPFAASRGYALNPGDRVDTRSGGRVVLDLSDGSMVIIQPGTLLSLRDFRAAASVRELFAIAVGAVRVKIHHLTGRPNPYRMNSPTASIAVRGTEFNVNVGSDGETGVEVFEGAVEVASLSDPSDRTLVEAGGGVLVRPGQALQLYGAPIARVNPIRAGGPGHADARAPERMRPPDRFDVERGELRQMARRPEKGPMAAPPAAPAEARYPAMAPPDHDGIATVADVNPLPMLYRFQAFSDLHLDAMENPAYAADARSGDVRMFLIPTQARAGDAVLRGMTPQMSVVQPVGRGIVAGGAFALSRLAGDVGASSAGSGMGFAAARLGSTGVGFSVERLSGTLPAFSATRMTAGVTRDLGDTRKIGVFFRYGLMDSAGRSTEAGFRLRGSLSPKLVYGIAGGVSRFDFGQIRFDRKSIGGGLGYLLTRRTLLSVDAAAGSGLPRSFASLHGSVQRDMTRRFFTTVSFLNVWGGWSSTPDALAFARYGARIRYVEAGPGVRISSGLVGQYLFSNDFALRASEHRLVLRYTFRPGGE